MKVAIYAEDGVNQLVLTPEGEFEQAAVDKILSNSETLKVMRGSFYKCNGGWSRAGSDDDSLILRCGRD